MDSPANDKANFKRTAERIVADASAGLHAVMTYIGDRLGIFKAMADGEPVSRADLAARTGLNERYLREWLGAMVAAQYIEYDPEAQTFRLTPDYAEALAREESPFFVAGYFSNVVAGAMAANRVAEAFRRGGGIKQAEYPPEMLHAAERNSAPRYRYKLLRKWLPAMPQVGERLNAGGTAVDVGCGAGRAAIFMARAFPKARILGIDKHAPSIERARLNAREAGVAERVRFEVGDAAELPAEEFDFISAFDVIHDAVDPVALLRAIRRALKPDGTFLMQEINVSDRLEENIGSMGRMVYSVSTLYCLTTSLAEGGAGLGAAMGPQTAKELAERSGFSRFRRLPIEDAFAALYEMRP